MELEEARKVLSQWVDYTRQWQHISKRSGTDPIMASAPEPIPMEIFSAVNVLLNATRETK